MNRTVHALIKSYCEFCTWAWALTFCGTFILAYIDAAYKITIDINYYGEANFEIVLIGLYILSVMYCLYHKGRGTL